MKEKRGKGAQSASPLPFLMMPVQKKSSSIAVEGQVEPGSRNTNLRVRAKKTPGTKKQAGVGSSVARMPVKRVRDYKGHAKKKLSEAFPAIVGVLIERAKEGSLTHAKFLFEIGGVKDEHQSRGGQKRHPSLAEILLKELAERGEKAAGVEGPEHEEAQQHGPKAADRRSEDKE